MVTLFTWLQDELIGMSQRSNKVLESNTMSETVLKKLWTDKLHSHTTQILRQIHIKTLNENFLSVFIHSVKIWGYLKKDCQNYWPAEVYQSFFFGHPKYICIYVCASVCAYVYVCVCVYDRVYMSVRVYIHWIE